MVDIGPRPAGSPAIQKTRDYIKQELVKAGLQPEEQAFDAQTPLGVVHMVNIRATLPGAAANGRIVIGGHYDTKLFKDIRFVGASDAASSAAFLLEAARSLKGRSNALPIELLFLDGEEAVVEWQGQDHTYGSRYYVEQLKKAGTVKDVKAFILVDMIGDKSLDIHREQYSTPWLTDAVWSAAKRLHRPEFFDDVAPVEDDHLEFLDAGIPSVDLIDLMNYPPWHKASDDLRRCRPPASRPSATSCWRRCPPSRRASSSGGPLRPADRRSESYAHLELIRARRHEVRAAERRQEVVERLLVGQVHDAEAHPHFRPVGRGTSCRRRSPRSNR